METVTYPNAATAEPARANTTVSAVNVENVVYPPSRAKKTASRMVEPTRPAWTPAGNPSRKLPVKFTNTVAHGKPPEVPTIRHTRYRSALPTAPPAPDPHELPDHE